MIAGKAFFTYTHSLSGSLIVCLLSKSCFSLFIIIVPTFLQSYTNLGISIGFHSFPTVFLYPASLSSLAICVEPFLAIMPSHISLLILACSGFITYFPFTLSQPNTLPLPCKGISCPCLAFSILPL